MGKEVPDVEGVCSNLPGQGEQVVEAFCRQLEVASCSLALVLMVDFNHTSIYPRENTVGHNQLWRFLESIDHNFPTQMTEEPTRRGALLDPMLTNKEKQAHWGCESQRLPWLQ